MLSILRRIVQEINNAHDFQEALEIMVKRVREAVETEACSVFLVDQAQKEYVLAATDGLKPQTIGKVRLKFNEGLVGLVGSREEPINLEDAPSHPNFSYHPEVGEEPYKAFMGVPIIHHRKLFGVMIVQQQENRRFDDEEEAFMITLSAHLAGIIAHAEATGAVSLLLSPNKKAATTKTICLEGIPGSPGVGIGTSVVVYPPADLEVVPDRSIKDINAEIEIFDKALKAARDDVEAMKERFSKKLSEEEMALFDVYLRILDSSGIGEEVHEEIRSNHWAQGALRKVIKRHIAQFEAMEDSYLKERAADIQDLGLRVLSHLQASQKGAFEYPKKTILIGDDVTASSLAEVPEGQLVGIVSMRGSSNSHVAILAKALGIAAVMGIEALTLSHRNYENIEMIVDGYYGQVYVSPPSNLSKQFEALAEEERELDSSLEALQKLPAVTPDGYHISLYVNIGLPIDAGLSLTVGAEGVGLYRTEVPFMIRDRFPAEEEQRAIYRQLLKAFAPRPVIMRTLDVGGDKPLPYFQVKEDNPFLGWRGIRITLDHPDMFLVQVRAMIKASKGLGNLRILLPMISSISELEEAIDLIDKAYRGVIEQDGDIKRPLIGAMIEVPSAVYLAKGIARRVDFLSVGTNDLTQYLLAVDRNNSRVARLFDSLHPSVVKALKFIAEAAHSEGKQVSICGEMASDPAAIILLLAMGFDVLSMNSISLPRMKWVIRSITMKQANELLQEVLQYENGSKIRFALEQALDQAGLGGLIRAGK